MFPPARAEIITNEAGEPVGWDIPDDDGDTFYCDVHGFSHAASCEEVDEYYAKADDE